MAIDRRHLLDLLNRIKNFDSSPTWESLSDDQKNLLEEFAVFYGAEKGIDTPQGFDVLAKLQNPKTSKNFRDTIQSIEAIEASFDEVTAGTIPPELLAEYQEYLKAQKLQDAAGGVITPEMSLAQTIKRAQYFTALRLRAEAIRAAHLAVNHPNLDPIKDGSLISDIVHQEAIQNNDLIANVVSQGKISTETTTKPVAQISALYIGKIAAKYNVVLSEGQKNDAIQTLASFIYSGGVVDLVDSLPDDPQLSLTPEKVDTASRNLVGAATVILQETLNPTITTDFQQPHTKAVESLQSFFKTNVVPPSVREQKTDPQLNQITVNQINDLSQEILKSDYRIAEFVQLASQNVYQVQLKFANASLARYKPADDIIITEKEINEVIAAYVNDHPGKLEKPTLGQIYNAAKAKAGIETTDPANTSDIAGIKAVHQGITLEVIKEIISSPSNSKLGILVTQKPKLFAELMRVVEPIQKSPLAKDIRTLPLTDNVFVPGKQTPQTPSQPPKQASSNPLRRLYNSTFGAISRSLGKLTDIVGSRSPILEKILNVIRSPVQSILRPFFAWAGRQAGVQAGRQFLGNVAAKAIGKVASEGVKKFASTIIEKGLGEGLKALVIRGAAALGIDIAVGATGVGVPLAVVMLIVQVGLMALGAAVDFVQKNSKDIGEQAIGAAFMFSTTISGLLGGLATVSISTGITLIFIVIFSIILGITSHIAINYMAPIISSIAQLESGSGVQQGISPSINYPDYTGPILPGCPSTWPVPPGAFILQGPHGTWSHKVIEAIDIYVPVGTTITSISSGTVTKTGWGNAYGNWIWISSTTQGGKAFSVIYSHLSETGVEIGDPVGVGSPIGLSGKTSSVLSYQNPHLHLEYRGLAYNSCPAGGVKIPEGCASAIPTVPGACLINKLPIYTN